MKIKLYSFCIVLLLIISSCKTLSIPSGERLDFIVLTTGDTLYGKMEYYEEKFRGPEYLKKVRLTDTAGKTKKFKWRELSAYRSGGADYVSFRLRSKTTYFKFGRTESMRYFIDPNGKQQFLKVRHIGPLSHYEIEFINEPDDSDPFWHYENVIKKADDNFFVNCDGSAFGLPKKLLSHYLSDCTTIQEKIMQKDLDNIYDVVEFYNKNCVVE